MTNRIKALLKSQETKSPKPQTWRGFHAEGRPRSLTVRLDVLLSAITGFQLIDFEDLPLMIRVIEFISNDSIACRHLTHEEIINAAAEAATAFTPWVLSQHPILDGLGEPSNETWQTWLGAAVEKVGSGEIEIKPMPISECGWTPPTEIFA